jgi:hypothetical protein
VYTNSVCSLPPCGGGLGRGGGAVRSQRRHLRKNRATPTPNPSPQGGGEHTEWPRWPVSRRIPSSRLVAEPFPCSRISRFQTAYVFSFPRRVGARGFRLCFTHPEPRGGRSAEKRSGACEAPVRHAVTRHARRLRGALRPITRDARLSALHRGDFGPGAALPSPALPPGPVERTPRSQVPGGGSPRPPGASGYEAAAAGRHASLRLQDRL